MKIKFIGAAGRVTGSCYWLKHREVEFLIDCGQVQGELHADFFNNRPFPFNPKNIMFLILTHAHLDHCGLIPRLYKEGFKGKVICTKATADLTKIVLRDSLNFDPPYDENDINEIKFACMEDGNDNFFKYYTIEEGLMILLKRNAHILGSVSVALSWKVSKDKWRTIEFSGDIGSNQEGKEHLTLPKSRKEAHECDYTVMESTYGGRELPDELKDFDKRIERLEKIVYETLIKMPNEDSEKYDEEKANKKLRLIISAFAVQRTQDIIADLYYIFRKNQNDSEWKQRKITIYFDYPLSLRVNEIYKATYRDKYTRKNGEKSCNWSNDDFIKEKYGIKNDDEFNKLLELFFPTEEKEYEWFPETETKLKVLTSEEHKQMGKKGTFYKIIITGGGMCEGGNIAKYMELFLKDEHSTFLLSGYQSVGTNGYKMNEHSKKTDHDKNTSEDFLEFQATKIETSKKRKKTSKSETIHIKCNEIKATVNRIEGYSGHADQKGLLEWFFNDDEDKKEKEKTHKTLFLTHGDNKSRETLKEKILEKHSEIGNNCELKVELPSKDDSKWFDLDKGEWIEEEETSDFDYEKLADLIAEKVVKRLSGNTNLLMNNSENKN